MKQIFVAICLIAVSCSSIWAQRTNNVYLFSYFTGNGEDGLHLAYSTDGLTWNT